MDAERLFDKLLAEVDRQEGGALTESGVVGKIGDGKLLKWLIENKETIIQLLPIFIALLGEKQ